MTATKLKKAHEAHEALRRKGGVSSREMQELASALGRTRFTGRGKEPTWINEQLPHLRPISIPDHGGGRDLKPGTKKSILTQLQQDLDAWAEKFETSQTENDHE